MKSYEKREQVLNDWKCGLLTVLQLAFKHDVAPSTILNWTKEAGLPSRRRGRRVQDGPSSKVRRILGLCAANSASEVAQMVGVTKQHISQLRQRWKDWSPIEPHKVTISCLANGKGADGDIKSHIVCFRLTPGEFADLKQLRASELQSPYETAREVVLRTIHAGAEFSRRPVAGLPHRQRRDRPQPCIPRTHRRNGGAHPLGVARQ